jgi:hypothetical protein
MMGWAAGFFGAGGAVLVFGCVLGMGLLIWLLFRLTGDSSAPAPVQQPGQVLDQRFSAGLIDLDGDTQTRPLLNERMPGGPGSSDSVAP